MLSRNLEQTLHRALAFANQRRHEYATLEHLLLARDHAADLGVAADGDGGHAVVGLLLARDEFLRETESILRLLRKLPPGTDNDFNLSTGDQIIATFDALSARIALATVALAGCGSLAVVPSVDRCAESTDVTPLLIMKPLVHHIRWKLRPLAAVPPALT